MRESGRRGLVVFALVAAIGAAAAGCAQGGAPLAAGTFQCIDVPNDICQRIVSDAAAGKAATVAAFVVQCTAWPCTAASGSVDLTITWSDGHTDASGLAWSGPAGPVPPAPQVLATPPVPPTCRGVPFQHCRDMWTSSVQMVPPDRIDQIAQVIVECTSSCTAQSGAGRTTIILRDGSHLGDSSWGYEGSP